MRRRTTLAVSFLAALALGQGGARAQFAGLYVSDVSTGDVDQVTPIGATPVVTGISDPQGLAISSDGMDLFVANPLANTVKVYQETSPTTANLINTITFASGVQPTDLALYNGNLFVTSSNGNIYELTSPTSNQTPTIYANLNPNGTGAAGVAGIVADGNGNFYISSESTNEIFKVPPGGGTVSLAGDGFTTVGTTGSSSGLAIDNNYLYEGNVNLNEVVRISLSNPSNQTVLSFPSNYAASGASGPIGVALDQTGNLYFTTNSGGYVGQIANPGTSPTATDYSTFLAGNSLSYAAYAPSFQPQGTGVPEPGGLALGAVVTLVGLAAWARGRQCRGAAAVADDEAEARRIS